MNRNFWQPRASTSFASTPKRKREPDDFEDHRKLYRNYGEDPAQNAVVEWKLTFDRPQALALTKRGYRTSVGSERVRMGTECETVNFDGTTACFRGCEVTAWNIHFTLPMGHMKVSWVGKRLSIDDNYSIDDMGFHVARRTQPRADQMRTVFVAVEGEYTEPMTLSFAERSYIIRLESGYPAIVLDRSTYYPLKLALMKDFVSQFIPKELFARGPRTPERLVDPRIPPATPNTPYSATPNTPDSATQTDKSSDELTSPTRYTRNERYRERRRGYVDEESDE